MKAADVDGDVLVTAIRDHPKQDGIGVSRWDLEPLFPDVPPKVLLAKLRKLTRQGRIDGCACGCRGDFTPARTET